MICQDHYLQEQGFKIGVADNNLYIKIEKKNLLITLVYVDALICGRNNDDINHGSSQKMSKEFEMSIIGELSSFLLNFLIVLCCINYFSPIYLFMNNASNY